MTTKKKTIAKQVDEVLDKLSHNDVKDYIRDYCNKDKSFRELFLARHLYLTQSLSKELFAKQIQAVVNSVSGDFGFIDYEGVQKVSDVIYELRNKADTEIEKGNCRIAMYIGWAILEEMIIILENGDDSNGELGNGFEQGLEILHAIVQKDIDKTTRKDLFDYCLMTFNKEIFKGWDWHEDILELAIELVDGVKEKQLINNALDQIQPTGNRSNYSYEKAQRMKLELIRKTESQENVQSYMMANLDISEFRKELIKSAITQQNYNYSIKLAMEGIIKDDSDKPGLANEWRMFLLKAYELQGDIHNTIQTARYLFLNSNSSSSEELYRKMKKYVAAEEWNVFFNQLVADKQKKASWSDFYSVSNMYIWEEQWENLLKLLLQYTSLENIASVEKYLAKEYAQQLIGLYQARILNYTSKYIGREHYVKACGYIRRMIKLGGRKESDALIMQLRKLYPQRRALMEELGRV